MSQSSLLIRRLSPLTKSPLFCYLLILIPFLSPPTQTPNSPNARRIFHRRLQNLSHPLRRRQAPRIHLLLLRLRRRAPNHHRFRPHQIQEGHLIRRAGSIHPHLLPKTPPRIRRKIRRIEVQGGRYDRLHFRQRRLRDEGVEEGPQDWGRSVIVERWERGIHEVYWVRAGFERQAGGAGGEVEEVRSLGGGRRCQGIEFGGRRRLHVQWRRGHAESNLILRGGNTKGSCCCCDYNGKGSKNLNI